MTNNINHYNGPHLCSVDTGKKYKVKNCVCVLTNLEQSEPLIC